MTRMSTTSGSQDQQAMFLRKWVGFVSALWLMIFSGCYTFPNYSTALKEVLGINQKHLNGLGIARDVGDSCIGIIAGIFSSHLPVWALLCISASFGLIGYGVEWLVVSQIIKPLPYWVLQSSSAEWWCCGKLPLSSFWRGQDLGEDKPTISLFKTWHFYLFYISLLCGCGSGVAFSNNLGQVGQSLGSNSADLFASLFSLGNFFGRLASGNISEYFLKERGIPRPAWMGLAKIPMIVLFLWLSSGSTASLYAGSVVLGFCHGSLVTLSIPIISEFYGLKHFGTNFMLIGTYFVAGSYIFSSMAGYVYDRQAVSGEESSSLTCYGSNCYGTTFQISASCLTIALVCDAILTIISRPLYQKLQLVTK